MIDRIVYYFRSLFKQPFKVGIISYYYPINNNGNNGVALHTYYLSRELANIGCEVHVFTKTEKKILKTEYIGQGKLFIHGIGEIKNTNNIEPVTKKRISYFVFDNNVINAISAENSRGKFDILHTHGWLTSGAFISKYINNVPWVHTLHALEKNRLKFMTPEEKKYFQIARWKESTIRSADSVICVSEQLRQESIREYNLKKEKTFVIPNGIDKSIFYKKEEEKKEQILYVGRFSLEKGIDFIPNIVQGILDHSEKTKFVVVASINNIAKSLEETKKQFEYLEKTYGGRFVWIKNTISPKDLSVLYNQSCILIQPSRYESFGMTIIEAMACGCAIVASNRGGIPEVVGQDGEVIPLNHGLFIRKINRLLNDPKLRNRYSKRALEKIKSFDWAKIAQRTLNIYQSSGKNKSKNSQNNEKIYEQMENMEKL